MSKLLLTGLSGFLGYYLAHHPQTTWTLMGQYRRHRPAGGRMPLMQANLIDPAQLEHLLRELRPEAVIHLAAAANPNWCEQHPQESYQINVAATAQLAEYCRKQSIRLIFPSTDLVFDGHRAPYGERAEPHPINLYGKQKREAELKLAHHCPEAIIARLPLMYGWPAWGSNFLPNWVDALRQGETVPAFTDEYRTPISGADAAAGLLLLLEKGQAGIYHLGGPRRLSRYELALDMAKAFGLSPDQIIPSKQLDVSMPAARPADVSLISTKSEKLGFQPLAPTEGLKALFR